MADGPIVERSKKAYETRGLYVTVCWSTWLGASYEMPFYLQYPADLLEVAGVMMGFKISPYDMSICVEDIGQPLHWSRSPLWNLVQTLRQRGDSTIGELSNPLRLRLSAAPGRWHIWTLYLAWAFEKHCATFIVQDKTDDGHQKESHSPALVPANRSLEQQPSDMVSTQSEVDLPVSVITSGSDSAPSSPLLTCDMHSQPDLQPGPGPGRGASLDGTPPLRTCQAKPPPLPLSDCSLPHDTHDGFGTPSSRVLAVRADDNSQSNQTNRMQNLCSNPAVPMNSQPRTVETSVHRSSTDPGLRLRRRQACAQSDRPLV